MSVYLIVVWFLLSAVDDCVVLGAWLWTLAGGRGRLRFPELAELLSVAERRIAVFVAAWREDGVIERMLSQNLAQLRYQSYVIFVGTYPNDRATQEAVMRAAAGDGRIRLVVGPRPGPSSKADCLNAVYQEMRRDEQRAGAFDLVVIHDAEDVLHPDELHWKNWFARDYDMVQTAVLPLATPARLWTHGVYCDDFAEYHTKDMRARNWLGGFVPSCGVATSFRRELLDELALGNPSGEPFQPDCLTEDYELGYRLHTLGARQLFVPLPAGQGPRLATREYFPQTWRAAVRQRSRWVTGIAFQGWKHHGWGRGLKEAYWFWRDRKGIVGNPLSLIASLATPVCLLMGWTMEGGSPGLGRMALAAGVLSGVNLAARAWCSGRIYGWAFGLLAPLRLLWANGINSAAVFVAARGVLSALWSGKGLAWRKTDHVYPWMGSGGEVRALGEILVNRRVLTSQELHRARVECPPGMKLAEFLLETGRVSAADIQRARNLQYGFAEPGPATIAPARLLPAPVAEHWRVVPVGIGPGEIYLASIDLPRPGLERELRRHTHRRPRLLLVTPARFGQLRAEFEGVEGCRTKAPTKKQKNHLHHLGVFAILTKRLWATQTFETSSSRESKEVKISGCKASEDLIG